MLHDICIQNRSSVFVHTSRFQGLVLISTPMHQVFQAQFTFVSLERPLEKNISLLSGHVLAYPSIECPHVSSVTFCLWPIPVPSGSYIQISVDEMDNSMSPLGSMTCDLFGFTLVNDHLIDQMLGQQFTTEGERTMLDNEYILRQVVPDITLCHTFEQTLYRSKVITPSSPYIKIIVYHYDDMTSSVPHLKLTFYHTYCQNVPLAVPIQRFTELQENNIHHDHASVGKLRWPRYQCYNAFVSRAISN